MFFVTTATALAQQVPLATPMHVEGVTYDPAVPRPDEVLGYVVGTRHTEPHRVVEYFFAIARASDRVTVAEHGQTHEGRRLIHAVVTSPGNHDRIQSIRDANRRLSDDPAGVSPAELGAMPAIVFLGYSVHGNEASGTEAALLTLYHLAAGSGPAVDAILDSLVVVIDPMLNPDGRDRFVDWVNRNRGEVHTTDSQDREHREPWPGGRTNHYWFDLNRDWLPARQPESRARLRLFHEWRPQLMTDFHEMGSDATYFFQPGVPSRTHPNTPERNQEITTEMAAYHARALDRLGQLYFTEEVFDDFYYGKGASYPDVNGAVGILFEQASSRSLESETESGPLSYAITVRNQFATSLSTLAAARDLRVDLLEMQRDFYANVEQFAADRGVGAYVVGLTRGRLRALEMARLLQLHRVRVYEIAGPVAVGGRELGPGEALVVPADQPQARLLDAALRSETSFRDSLFYDVSAWTLPHAFDVDVYEIGTGDLPIGKELAPVHRPAPDSISAHPDAVAILVVWDGLASARFLGRIQKQGLAARIMTRAFMAQSPMGRDPFPAGTVVIPVRQQGLGPDSVFHLVGQAAAQSGTQLHVTISGLTPEGPDLGGRSSRLLSPPRVALLTGRGTSSTRTGEVWSFLSESLGLAVSLLDLERLDSSDLGRYDALIFAGGRSSDSTLTSLDSWLHSGGRLIALGSAAADVGAAGLLELTERPFDLDSLTAGVSWSERGTARGAHSVGGAILKVELDATHPLAFGIGETVPTFRTNGAFYDAGSSTVAVGQYAEDPLLSGYMSVARLESAAGSVALAVTRKGKGAVIVVLDEPVFRGFWQGSSRLLANAVFLGGSF